MTLKPDHHVSGDPPLLASRHAQGPGVLGPDLAELPDGVDPVELVQDLHRTGLDLVELTLPASELILVAML